MPVRNVTACSSVRALLAAVQWLGGHPRPAGDASSVVKCLEQMPNSVVNPQLGGARFGAVTLGGARLGGPRFGGA